MSQPRLRNLEMFDGRWLIEPDGITADQSERMRVAGIHRRSVDDCRRNELSAAETLRAHLADLSTIEAIKDYIYESHDQSINVGEPLAIVAADPGPLLARVIRLAGPNGMTRQRLFDILHLVGRERVQRALDTMLADGTIQSHIERRSSAVGRLQRQTVYR